MAPGQRIKVDRMPAEQGSTVELAPVLVIADGEQVTLGKPAVEGAKVIAEVIGHEKGDKVLVYKYKSKVRYRRKKGHRQLYTELAIKEIITA